MPAFSHTALTLGEKAEGVYNDGYSYDSFSFTATEAGSYVFTSYSDCDMYGNLYSDSTLNNLVASDDDSYGNNQFRIVYELEAGQTVYLKPTAYSYYYDYHASYSVRVINAEQDFSDKTTDALSPVAVTAEMEVEPNSYTIDEKTAYFRLNADENVSTYTFDIQNVEQTEPMTVTFYYSNGFEIVPDEYVELTGGTTNNDGLFTVSFDPFAFGGDGYIFVKIETSENNIGDVNISYTYDADENVQGGDEEEEEDIIATLTESNSGAQVTSSSNRAIVKVEHVDSDYYGTVLVYLNTGNTATAWISYSDTPSFDDVSDDAETDTSFVLDAFNGPFYVMIESQDGNAIGDVSVSFIGNGPVAEEPIPEQPSTVQLVEYLGAEDIAGESSFDFNSTSAKVVVTYTQGVWMDLDIYSDCDYVINGDYSLVSADGIEWHSFVSQDAGFTGQFEIVFTAQEGQAVGNVQINWAYASCPECYGINGQHEPGCSYSH